eukprot:524260_1
MSIPISPITNTSRTRISIPHSPIYSSCEEQEKQEQKRTHEQEDMKNPNKKSSHLNTNTPKDNNNDSELVIHHKKVKMKKIQNKKWQQISSIQHYLMYSCHIERLYSDLVIVHNKNNKQLNIIRINDNSLLETIIILG